MEQRADGWTVHTESVSKQQDPGSLSNVQAGDVLVSHPTAVREHEISIVPNAPHATFPTHDAALSDGHAQAEAIGVDGWLTEDQTHVVKFASNRAPANGQSSQPSFVAHQSETQRSAMTGTIKTLRAEKGFGFISDSAGKEFFFHQSAIYGEGIDKLREGDSVEFEVGAAGPKGPRAENVRRKSS